MTTPTPRTTEQVERILLDADLAPVVVTLTEFGVAHDVHGVLLMYDSGAQFAITIHRRR